MNTSRVTDKGQTTHATTTIPKERREKYGIGPGDTVIWNDTDAGIIIRKVIEAAGRGRSVDAERSPEAREEIARALDDELHARRDTDWAGA